MEKDAEMGRGIFFPALILWRLELKRTIKKLPGMLLEALLLLLALCGVVFGIVRYLHREEPLVQITVAVADEEKNPLTQMLLQYIEGMESVSKHCQFLTVTEAEGFMMLEEGSAAAFLILPSRMVEGIIDGTNEPVRVFFPKDAGLESALLKELTDSGMQMLSVAQAEIYGIYDTAKAYGGLEQLSVLEMDIDRYNLAFALDRLALYQKKEVSATGKLSLLQHGIASGTVFFLLLLGMTCYPMMQPYSKTLQKQLIRQGIGIGKQCFGKWMCGFCSMSMGFAFFWLLLKAILHMTGHATWLPKAGNMQVLTWMAVWLCAAAFVFFIFQLSGNSVTAILLLFFLAVLMAYCSGGFLPSVFLPEAVQRIGAILPTTYLIKAVGDLYLSGLERENIGILLLYTVLFTGAAYGLARCSARKGAGA